MTDAPTVLPLLEIDRLVVDFKMRSGARQFRAVDGVSLHVDPGEVLGIVGESGSGKTTVGRAVLGLAPISGGEVRFSGRLITRANRKERMKLARDLQVVFQDPYSSLNPSMTVAETLAEPLSTQGLQRGEIRKRIAELLDQINLPTDALNRLPREFSGGQRQRIAIARALAMKPKLIICDEPVSALDLSTQARILDLFLRIQLNTGVAYLFISHDLDVVRHMSHRIAVMRSGKILEEGQAEEVITRPQHPYTQRLLAAAPVPDPEEQARRRRERNRLREVERQTALFAGPEARPISGTTTILKNATNEP